MKTHGKTLIILLIICMAVQMMPALVFAASDPAAAAAEEGPAISENKETPAGEAQADGNTDGETEGDETESKDKEEQMPDPEDTQTLKETEPETDPAGSEAILLKKAPLRAAAEGEQISYTAARDIRTLPVIFKATLNGKEYKGTCNECGVVFNTSGTMTVVALDREDLRRKVAYKYGNWLENDDRNYSMGGVYKGVCLESMLQYAREWMDDKESGGSENRTAIINHWRKSGSSGGNGWSEHTCTAITDAVKALDGKTADELGIPNEFRAYHGIVKNTTNDEGRIFGQDPVFWGAITTGGISIRKVPESGCEEYVAAHPEEFDLTGAKYQLWTDEACTVKATDVDWNNAVLTTKADGTTNELTMEVGDYYLTEIQKPAKGYGLDIDKITGKAAIHKETVKENKTTAAVYAEPVEASKVFVKKVDASGKALANARLQIYEANRAAGPEWTSDGTDHEVTGLTSGRTYTLRELAAPAGCDIADDVSFRVDTAGTTVVTMKNIPVTVTTTAVSKATNKNIGQRKAGEVITDTVHMTGLVSGRKYKLTGQLMNKRTGSAISGASASREFTAAAETMDVTLDISFDSTALADGDSVVVYETLYRTSRVHGETVPVELKKHHDINDTAQTVTYPWIRTKASISGDKRVITDTVSYGNLLPGKKYVFRGWLVDSATGKKISGSDGRAELNAGDNTNGSVAMKLDASGYDSITGHSIAAFEELYITETVDGTEKEVKIAEHKDRSGDASRNPQIIEIYQDLKIEKNVTGNLGDLSKVFEYKAEFTGLVPDQPYKIEGDDVKTFMADASGKASAGIRLKDGQTAVIRNLPKGASYKVTEAASDHIAEYRMFSEDMADKGAKIIKAGASNGADAGKALATESETVDQFDGTVVILWENNRDLAAITGVAGPDYMVYSAALVLLAAGVYIIIRKRKKYADKNDIPA